MRTEERFEVWTRSGKDVRHDPDLPSAKKLGVTVEDPVNYLTWEQALTLAKERARYMGYDTTIVSEDEEHGFFIHHATCWASRLGTGDYEVDTFEARPYDALHNAADNPTLRWNCQGAEWSSLVEVAPGTGSRVWYVDRRQCQTDTRLARIVRKLSVTGEGFDPARVTLTHRLLGEVQESDPEVIFAVMQGEVWSPNGEARQLIERLGLFHTSMSVGDVIETPTDWHVCLTAGWLTIPKDERNGEYIPATLEDVISDLEAEGYECAVRDLKRIQRNVERAYGLISEARTRYALAVAPLTERAHADLADNDLREAQQALADERETS